MSHGSLARLAASSFVSMGAAPRRASRGIWRRASERILGQWRRGLDVFWEDAPTIYRARSYWLRRGPSRLRFAPPTHRNRADVAIGPDPWANVGLAGTAAWTLRSSSFARTEVGHVHGPFACPRDGLTRRQASRVSQPRGSSRDVSPWSGAAVHIASCSMVVAIRSATNSALSGRPPPGLNPPVGPGLECP